MCACDEGYVCSRCRDTRHDPGYFDVDDTPQEPLETERPTEYEVVER
jgi:hypothetical protein